MTEITIRPARHDANGNRIPYPEPTPSTLVVPRPATRFTRGRVALLGAAALTLGEGLNIGCQSLALGGSEVGSAVLVGAGLGIGLFALLYPPSAPGLYGGTPMDGMKP